LVAIVGLAVILEEDYISEYRKFWKPLRNKSRKREVLEFNF